MIREEISSSMFILEKTQIHIAQQWNQSFSWGISDEAFENLGEPPEIPGHLKHDGNLYAVILDIRFDSIEHTVNRFWEAVKSSNPESYCWSGINTDISHFYISEGLKHTSGLSWKIVKLSGNRGHSANQVRENSRNGHGIPAASSLLWSIAYFMEWSRSIYGRNVSNIFLPKYYICVPGYKVKLPDQLHYTDVLFFHWDLAKGNLIVDVANASYTNEKWVTPSLI